LVWVRLKLDPEDQKGRAKARPFAFRALQTPTEAAPDGDATPPSAHHSQPD